MKYVTVSLLILFALGLMIPNAFAESVPDWVKNTAGWWADDAISETEFVNAIQYLIKRNIIQVTNTILADVNLSPSDRFAFERLAPKRDVQK